ncbi:glycosidase [Patescibacteria group bacterium]
MKTENYLLKILRTFKSFLNRLLTFTKKAEKFVDHEIEYLDKDYKYKKKQGTKLTKVPHNPIIKPNGDNWWESWQVFNPGVIHIDETTHIFYRSIGEDGLSRFGYANVKDGYNVSKRLSYPVYSHKVTSKSYFYSPSGGSYGGCEDPRVTKVDGDDNIYITYTACDGGLRVALSSIDVHDFVRGKWKWAKPVFMSPKGEVHKNWVIFPEKINGKYAVLHSITPDIQIEYLDDLEFKDNNPINSTFGCDPSREGMWDSWVRGVGPPPVKTDKGWLIFYHGMDKKNPSEYKVGAMLTDINDPTKVLHRSKTPIMEPDQLYENNGFKSGVVYVSGAIVKGGKLLVYYGASDSYIAAATAKLNEFLEALINEEKVAFKTKVVNKKS